MKSKTTQARVSGTLDQIVRLEDCRENFRDDDGNPFVVRCPKCRRENWAMAVASGQCAWCWWHEQNPSHHDGAAPAPSVDGVVLPPASETHSEGK